MSKVIDFRVRPPFGAYKPWLDSIGPDNAFIKGLGLGYEGALKEKTLDAFFAELDEAGIEKAVVPGRHHAFINVDNQDILDFAAAHADRIIAFPLVDAVADDALEQVERYILGAGAGGASFEPGMTTPTVPEHDFDDERAYPVYDALQAAGKPILVSESALFYKNINLDTPRQVDKVARAFPNLKIVVGHGGWPQTTEYISVAFRNPNVYLAPDFYAADNPGAEDYWHAARTILREKIIFESSFPLAPIANSVEFVRTRWGLDDEALENVLYANAARVLGL